MTAAAINFACPQCQKKFSTPAAFAGKSLKCSCGNSITVPSPQSAGASMPSAAGSYPSINTGYQTSSQSAPTSLHTATGLTGNTTPSQSTSRRKFPALEFVAKCINVIAWLALVINTLAIVIAVFASIAANPGGISVILGIAVGGIAFLFAALMVVFIRASAELIRLGLYVAELLEDIRGNTA